MIVGALGGGQLGRMLALAAYPFGIQMRFLDPTEGACCSQLAELIVAPYEDAAALDQFAEGIALATYEFENVPVETVERLARRVPVCPSARALAVAQDRLNEKRLFEQLEIPVPAYAAVDSRAALETAVAKIGAPCVLKTRRSGYDGKGQAVIHAAGEVNAAYSAVGGGEGLIVEQFVAFDREVSLVAARGGNGDRVFYPLVENYHAGGILRTTLAPAPNLSAALQALAERHVGAILDALDYVGVLAVEFFEKDGRLYANEMAPRVHNSGHWTIEGARTSQFENHLRAILGRPLGATGAVGCSAMVNLIGTMPDPADVLAIPDAHFHDYGKSPRPGRKLGHVTLRAEDDATLRARLARLREIVP